MTDPAADPANKALILVVEDDEADAGLIARALEAADREIRVLGDAETALSVAREGADLVIADRDLPGMSGVELVRRMREEKIATPVLIVSGEARTAVVVEAMKAGALDYLQKPFDISFLRVRAAQALELRSTSQELAVLRRKVARHRKADSIIGVSAAIAEVRRLIGTVELAARILHEQSERIDKPFVVVDCAALPEHLLENELFGHEPGAYTGADRRSAGLLGEADGGTLFIDEIGEMPLSLQVKLLRFLQTKEFRRIGASRQSRVDVRVVTATHRDLEAMVARGAFRQDLFYRINVFPIRLPALRERREDVPLLADHFVRVIAKEVRRQIDGFTPEAMEVLAAHDWPGNVRQLENVVRRMLVLAESDRVGVAECATVLGARARAPQSKPSAAQSYHEAREQVLASFEKSYLSTILHEAGENVAEAARRAGLDRKTFWLKLKRHGISRSAE